MVAAVAHWCQEDGVSFTVDPVAPGRPNLLASFSGNRPGPTLLFEAHSDTVTAGNPAEWTHSPFRLTKEGDRLYGRGSADTKGNLVAAFLGIRALIKETSGDFPGTILFLVPVDEEGMMTGIRHFIASGGVSEVDGAICCEPEDGQVCISQKGALRLRAEIYGKMAHGAMPLTGNNPITLLAQFLLAIQEEERAEQERVGFDHYLGWPSITPTQVMAPMHGPSGFNVMPATAAVSIDCRTVAAQSHNDLTKRLEGRLQDIVNRANNDLVKGYGHRLRQKLEQPVDPGLYTGKLVMIDSRPVTHTPPDHPLVQAMGDALEESLGCAATYAGVPGATDGTWLWDAGIPIVTTGAGDRFVPHQVDEWVSLEQLVDTAAIYADAAYRFLSNPDSIRKKE